MRADHGPPLRRTRREVSGHLKLRFGTAGLLIALCLLMATETYDANAQTRHSSLRKKHSAVRSKIREIRKEIRNIKAEQATQKNRLVKAQVDLDEAQSSLRKAAARLSHTRSTLVVVRQDHKRAKLRHEAQRKRMEARILAQYEAGNPSYLEVVLDATTFADFTERAEITQSIANRDQTLLRDLLTTRRALATQKARLEAKEREEAEAKVAVQRERNNVAVKAEVAEKRLKAANQDRLEAERQLAAMEEASRDIEAMLARVQRGGSSAGAYSGKWGGSFLRPVPGRITSSFGWRIHPITHTRRFHDGVDLACSGGTSIRAADKGRVVHAGWWGPYGLAILIDHGSGVSTLYGHCMRGSVRVSTGQVVSRGQVIAGVDSTGWSTGNHLHFGVRRFGRPVSPF